MDLQLNLGNHLLNSKTLPYVIAEIGVNHEGSMDQARHLIDLAKEGGADAAKFQSYKADTLASKNSPAYWDTNKEPTSSQHELFSKYDQFGADDYIALAEHCRQVEIDFLSTPFDDEAIEFLDPLMSFFKIASADITNIPFLRKVAEKKKPVVLSTGASTLGEIDIAVETLTKEGCNQIALLHCILNYPTENANAHLRMIEGLKRAYPQHSIGYSDHTLPDEGMTTLVTANLLGAVILEKHFTHDKTLPGNDHYHAMDVNDLKNFMERIHLTHELIGDSQYKHPIKTESISREHARRSIVLTKQLSEGHMLSEEDLTYKRPASGISPLNWDQVLGTKINRDLDMDHVLKWSDLINQ